MVGFNVKTKPHFRKSSWKPAISSWATLKSLDSFHRFREARKSVKICLFASRNRTGRKREHMQTPTFKQLSRATAGSTGCNPDSLSTAGSRVSFTISSTPCLVRNWWEPNDSVVAHLLWVKWHEISTKSWKMYNFSACSIIQHPLLLRLGCNTSFAVLLLSLLSATAINTSQTTTNFGAKCPEVLWHVANDSGRPHLKCCKTRQCPHVSNCKSHVAIMLPNAVANLIWTRQHGAISNHFPSSWLPNLQYPLAQTLPAPQPSEWPTGFWKLNWHPAAERPSEHLTDFSAMRESSMKISSIAHQVTQGKIEKLSN